MSIEQPIHLADFDYRDSAQVTKYATAMKRIEELDAAWKSVEIKLAALSELTDETAIATAITELEALRDVAYTKSDRLEAAIGKLLPDVVDPQQGGQ